MIKGLICTICVFVFIVLIIISVGYWMFNSATLDKLGYADVVIDEVELPNGEVHQITPRTLGIENKTLNELLDWFKEKVNNQETANS